MEPLLSEQVAYYDARAPEYEDWWFRRGRYALPAHDAARWGADVAEVEAALDAFGPSGAVLEMACGTGLWTRQLARHATHLVAVDGAAAMLELNRARLPATSKAAVKYVQADLFSWRPPAAAFDAAVFGYWLSHVPDQRMANFWQGVRGALREGGRVFFVDSAPDPGLSEWPSAGTEERDLADGRRFTVVKRYRTPEVLQELLATPGWRCHARLTTNRMIVYGTAQTASSRLASVISERYGQSDPHRRGLTTGGDLNLEFNMTVRIASVTFDCANALTVGRLWSGALGRPLDPKASIDFAAIGFAGRRDKVGWAPVESDNDPTWMFVKVPEPKIAKNRMHLDLVAPDPEAEVARLVDLGATRVADMDEYGYTWTVMADPEGNEFCVAKAR